MPYRNAKDALCHIKSGAFVAENDCFELLMSYKLLTDSALR
jgi:hypothetical protein